MIEDKDMKVAENPIEAMWERVRMSTEQRIKGMEESLIVEKAILELAKVKMAESIKN